MLLYHSPQLDMEEKIVGQDKDRETSLSIYCHG